MSDWDWRRGPQWRFDRRTVHCWSKRIGHGNALTISSTNPKRSRSPTLDEIAQVIEVGWWQSPAILRMDLYTLVDAAEKRRRRPDQVAASLEQHVGRDRMLALL